MKLEDNMTIVIKVVKNEKSEKILRPIEESWKDEKYKEYFFTDTDKENVLKLENNKIYLDDRKTYKIIFVIFEKERGNYITALYVGTSYKKGNNLMYKIKKKIEGEIYTNNVMNMIDYDVIEDFKVGQYTMLSKNNRLNEWTYFMLNSSSTNNFEKCIEKQETVSNEKSAEVKSENDMLPDDNEAEYSFATEKCDNKSENDMDEGESNDQFREDCKKIIHSKAFRRMIDKTQVFTPSKGDYYRNRMTHTLEVAEIAKRIASSLSLDVDLTEAIALAHDLGHTPFGHQGERTLDKILKGKYPDVLKVSKKEGECPNIYGGFKHNYHGVRIVSELDESFYGFKGMNLSNEVMEGILKHTTFNGNTCNEDKCNECEKYDKCFKLDDFVKFDHKKALKTKYDNPTRLEGQVVKIADEIAQRVHDLDDAFSAGLITVEQLKDLMAIVKYEKYSDKIEKCEKELRAEHREFNRIFSDDIAVLNDRVVNATLEYLIDDVCTATSNNLNDCSTNDSEVVSTNKETKEKNFTDLIVSYSDSATKLDKYMEKVITNKVINSTEVRSFDNKAEMIIKALFKAYYSNPMLLQKRTLKKMTISMIKLMDDKEFYVIDLSEGDVKIIMEEFEKIKNYSDKEDDKYKYFEKNKIFIRCIVDYIAGMTDTYAMQEYNRIYGCSLLCF